MNVIRFASITKKVTLAVAAAFLVLFLLVHLGINLCLLRSDGGEWYRAASQFMGSNYIVKVIEIVLFAAIFIHIIVAILLQIQNWKSRPVRYAVASKSKTSFMSKYMIWTGLLLLSFFALHFYNFYAVKLGVVEGKYMMEVSAIQKYFDEKVQSLEKSGEINDPNSLKTIKLQDQAESARKLINTKVLSAEQKEISNLTQKEISAVFDEDFKHYEPDFYTMCKELFQNKIYSFIYIFCFLVLAFHLNHGFRSVFQTFGFNHNKYNKAISCVGTAYAVLMFVGFSIIPLFILFVQK